ncbi:hypothetical protein HDU79_003378 [Rhizoclosmatium sp. JEL0117]|nr:hypothetical protein HDU79_003378 [Rhizoclosmatium sp. JEL0117]
MNPKDPNDLEEGTQAVNVSSPTTNTTLPKAEIIYIVGVFMLALLLGVTEGFFRITHKTTALSFTDALAQNDFPGLDAYTQLTQIAQKPHPSGSPENDRIFTYLLTTLQEYQNTSKSEMQVIIHDNKIYQPFKQLLVYFPGTTNSTVLFSAHFDSVPVSPGASDDGAAITVLLQLAQIYSTKTSSKSRNSFLLFFNNAEEVGLVGSYALLNDPTLTPYVKNIKVFANFEGGGAGGKPILFRTTSSQLTQAYADLAYPHMSSFGGDLLDVLGSRTDYQRYVKAGIPGFDVAYYENRRFYHTPEDSLDKISPEDVQYMGSNALALSRNLLNATWIDDLKIESKNAFYDHFGGYSPVIISSAMQMGLVVVLAVGLVASLCLGYFYVYVPFQIPTSSTNKPIYFFTRLAVDGGYTVAACVAGFVVAIVVSAIPWGVGIKISKATNASWLMVSLCFIGSLIGAWFVAGWWQSRQTSDDEKKGPAIQDSGLQVYIGLVVACILALVFTALNLPALYLLALGAIARMVVVAILKIKTRGSKVPLVYEISPVGSVVMFGSVLAVVTFYPLLMLTDFLLVMSRHTVGTYFFAAIVLLTVMPIGGALLSVLVHVKSVQGRRIILLGSIALVTVFTLLFVVLCYV